MIELIYPKGYGVDGFDIIGKWGRPLKADRRDVFTLQVAGEPPLRATRYKLVWCARHRVDVRFVPREYSFRVVNGELLCETFSDRMSMTRRIQEATVKVKWEDYDFIEHFAAIAKAMLKGEPDKLAELFALLNSQRDACISYARTASGGVSQTKAIDYTDRAIYHVFQTVVSGTRAVPSPIASIKWHINNQIRLSRNLPYTMKNSQD